MTVFTGALGKDLAIIIVVSLVAAVIFNIGAISAAVERLGWF